MLGRCDYSCSAVLSVYVREVWLQLQFCSVCLCSRVYLQLQFCVALAWHGCVHRPYCVGRCDIVDIVAALFGSCAAP
jgi:hypothetical protein